MIEFCDVYYFLYISFAFVWFDFRIFEVFGRWNIQQQTISYMDVYDSTEMLLISLWNFKFSLTVSYIIFVNPFFFGFTLLISAAKTFAVSLLRNNCIQREKGYIFLLLHCSCNQSRIIIVSKWFEIIDGAPSVYIKSL